MAGIAYTLLTGAEVPTVRSCVAAMLVLFALVLGRDALSLRMVAVAAGLLLRVGAALEQAPVGIVLAPGAAQHGAGMKAATGPDPFALQGRIEREGRLPLLGVAQLDRIGEGISREAQTQAHRLLARAALHPPLPLPHLPAQPFRAGPHHRRQAPLPGQGPHHLTAGSGDDQVQGPLQIRLAAAVGPRHQRQPVEGKHHVLQGAVAAQGEMADRHRKRMAARLRAVRGVIASDRPHSIPRSSRRRRSGGR
ncbi:ComEC/Rec2 family competence protein [Synechococcus sp. BA-124 BA4]|uniref:ComEC/Rec2 family competence protein n=1 Tax=Synechococcus sp. BA-124 BA4 TaxID=3110251 RepID=UPI003A4C5A84